MPFARAGPLCYNAESPKPKGPLDFVCAHAGDGQPYLAQGSSMQQDRRIRLGVYVRLSKCCKPGTLPMGRSLIPRACRQDICTVIPDGGNQRILLPRTVQES